MIDHFVSTCGYFEWYSICAGYNVLLLVYICVAFKDSTTILSVPIQVLDLHGACHGLFYVQ